ncbi:YbaB/EbfC family nucleoid-associated protein [Gordonia bronchialis]|jgi:DNA-binding protein YbaB|uniref:YbaB/EbfC family nucleoid-associated protein n=1 Tax=Gordonia bronchialis TaxID=2054 RepID=UPI002430D772|nr:YbaB/EbfC family nucleoid-associated protein [Gordonia bronchialis]
MRTLANSVLARIEKQRDLMETLNSETTAIRVRVSSPDKVVTVEVDGVGAMTGLWLSPGITKHTDTSLSALIIETAQHAARASLQRRNQLVQEFTARFADQQAEGLERWDGTTVVPQRPQTELPQPQPRTEPPPRS